MPPTRRQGVLSPAGAECGEKPVSAQPNPPDSLSRPVTAKAIPSFSGRFPKFPPAGECSITRRYPKIPAAFPFLHKPGHPAYHAAHQPVDLFLIKSLPANRSAPVPKRTFTPARAQCLQLALYAIAGLNHWQGAIQYLRCGTIVFPQPESAGALEIPPSAAGIPPYPRPGIHEMAWSGSPMTNTLCAFLPQAWIS